MYKKVLILSKFDAYWRVINDLLVKEYKDFNSCKELIKIISMDVMTERFKELFYIEGNRIDLNTHSEKICEYLSDLNSVDGNNIAEQIIEENFVNFNLEIDIKDLFLQKYDALDSENIVNFISDKIPEIVMMEIGEDTYSTIWEYSNKSPLDKISFCKKLFAKICSNQGDYATAGQLVPTIVP